MVCPVYTPSNTSGEIAFHQYQYLVIDENNIRNIIGICIWCSEQSYVKQIQL